MPKQIHDVDKLPKWIRDIQKLLVQRLEEGDDSERAIAARIGRTNQPIRHLKEGRVSDYGSLFLTALAKDLGAEIRVQKVVRQSKA